MMTEVQAIVAYLEKGVWYTPEEVREKRTQRSPELVDAMPYTLAALRRRQEYGRDVPEWVNLDK
jgi:hypothetical protein